MLEIAFVIITTAAGFVLSRKNILLLLIAILPFNDFLKSFFSLTGSDGNIFSMWKEILIIILLIKSYNQVTYKLRKQTMGIYVTLGFIVLFSFFISISEIPISVSYRSIRNIMIVPLLFYSCSNLKIDRKWVIRFYQLFSFAVVIIAIIGIWEIHFDGRLILRTFMGDLKAENELGVFYNTSNFTIMGYDRMCSVMTVPNNFGYLMAFSSIFSLFFYRNFLNNSNIFQKTVVLFVFSLSLFCLLESFCRTGYVMFFIAYFADLYYRDRKKFFSRLIKFGFAGTIILIGAMIFVEPIRDVITATFSGQEASSADRKNNFTRGILGILESPWGFGLGSSNVEDQTKFIISESSFINTTMELGVVGMIIYLLYLKRIYTYIKNNFLSNPIFTPLSLGVFLANFICFFPVNIFGAPYVYLVYIFSGLTLTIYEEFNQNDIAHCKTSNTSIREGMVYSNT